MNNTISLMEFLQVFGFLGLSVASVVMPAILDKKLYKFNVAVWIVFEFILMCLFFNPLHIHINFVMGA